MCMRTLTFLDSEPSWLCSKLVAWLRLYLGTTGLLPVWEPCNSSVCVHALSSTSSYYYSSVWSCTRLHEIMLLVQRQAYRLLISSKEAVNFSANITCFFISVHLKEMDIFFSILLKYQVVSLLVVRTGELVLEMYFFATDFPEHGVRIFSD